MLKKLVTFIISALTMSIMISTAAFAAAPTDFLTSKSGDMEINMIDKSTDISPRAWPGEGPAKPVTELTVEDIGFLNANAGPEHEGNVGIVVRMIGYGTKTATYDKILVDYFKQEPIILYGTLADGFYYIFDCGVPTLGDHRFEMSAKSHNAPGNTMTTSAEFTFTPVK